jgi:hypothetical protein
METMNESSFASSKTIYRLSWFYRLYHFAVGVAALVGTVIVHEFLIMSVGLALFSVFMISRPLIMAVTVDQFSVTFRGTFSAHSLQRSSITAVENKHTGKGNLLILWGNIDEKESLVIPDLFNFDDAWDKWWKTHRDLSDGKPLRLF